MGKNSLSKALLVKRCTEVDFDITAFEGSFVGYKLANGKILGL